jgi:hypothetical protein
VRRVSATTPDTPARSWHVRRWGPLGWTETALKAAGVAVGVAALVSAVNAPVDRPSGVRLAQVIILAVLSLGLLAAIADRVADREVIGLVFVLLMNAGHWCMTIALTRDGDLGAHLVLFCALMLAGDLVKLVFLRSSGFRVRDISPAVVYGLTSAYAVGYVVLAALQPVA